MKKNNRGQIKLSFGMIFSIILIIIFLAFAVFAIQKFLGVKNSVETGKFVGDFQNDIDKMWKSSQGSQEKEYFLPSKIERVCFVNYNSAEKGENSEELYKKLKQIYYGDENLFFYPVGSGDGLDATEIEHLDIEKITEEKNPYCVENKKGKVTITISKNFDENLVRIE
jgi:hypothetical protein